MVSIQPNKAQIPAIGDASLSNPVDQNSSSTFASYIFKTGTAAFNSASSLASRVVTIIQNFFSSVIKSILSLVDSIFGTSFSKSKAEQDFDNKRAKVIIYSKALNIALDDDFSNISFFDDNKVEVFNQYDKLELLLEDEDNKTKIEELKSLVLYGVSLPNIPEGVFDAFTNLETLMLKSTEVEKLPAGIFDKNTKLTYLDLGGNNISSLPEGLFDNLSELHTLILTSLKTKSLPKGVFDNLSDLRDLAIVSSKLQHLPEGVFDKLTQLEKLWLDDNKELKSLPKAAFDKLTNLQELSCEDLSKLSDEDQAYILKHINSLFS